MHAPLIFIRLYTAFEGIEQSSFLWSHLFNWGSSRYLGLNISNPVDNGNFMYNSSTEVPITLTASIKGFSQFSLPEHIHPVSQSRLSICQDLYDDLYTSILDNPDPFRKRETHSRYRHGLQPFRFRETATTWLVLNSVILCVLNTLNHYCSFHQPVMNAGKTSQLLTPSTVRRVVCMVTQKHNEVWNVLHDLSAIAWHQLVKESVIQEADSTEGALIGDFDHAAPVESGTPTIVVFNIIGFDSDAPSHVSRPVKAVLKSAEREKKSKYNTACKTRHSSFTLSLLYCRRRLRYRTKNICTN